MKNFILFLSLFVFLALNNESKAQPYYYNSGIPTLFESWGNLPGGGGAHPPNFAQNTEYIIESGKTAVVDFQWFLEGFSWLEIRSGATLQINHTVNMGAGTTLGVDSLGTIIYNSTTVASNTIFGGNEIFHAYSNFKINNWSNINQTVINGVTQHLAPAPQHLFGNLEINWTDCPGDWYQNLDDKFLCANDFRITSTGFGRFLPGSANNSNRSFLIKNYYQTDGELDLSFGSTYPTYATLMQVTGDFIKTGGALTANGASTYGHIYLGPDIAAPGDTVYQKFFNSGTLNRVFFHPAPGSKLRLLSDLPLNTASLALGFLAGPGSVLDCGIYNVTGIGPFGMANHASLKIGSPIGYNCITTTGPKNINQEHTVEYNGTSAQVTGDSLLSSPLCNLIINNPAGVTLSKNTWLGVNKSLTFVTGKLNLGNSNLKINSPDSIEGVNENSFINTNGTGCLRIDLHNSYLAKFPVGNTTFSPLYITQAYGSNDTTGIRVENSFGSHLPFDSSKCVRKVWRIFDDNPSNGTYFKVAVQFLKSDAGSNIDYASSCAVGQYETGYNGYIPKGANIYEQFYIPPDSTISKAIYGTTFSTTGDDYFIAGNEDGIFETYFPDNSGDAAQLGNWSSIFGLHPPSFDRYAIFSVPQGQTASFNNPVNFSDKAYLRSTGNGVINANAPLTISGILEIYDSSTYNHNNTGIASQTCFAGREFCHRRSNFNILKWSDTTDKIFDENELSFGNLTIDFNNLPSPAGANNYWTVFKNIPPYYTNFSIRGNLKYIQSSGYQFAPIGYGNNVTEFTVYGNVQIGDSLNQTAFPVINLSGGTTRTTNMTAGTLNICGNLDIQNGGLTSQYFPATARGKINFKREVSNVPQSHIFYCYNPFLPQTNNLGNPSFPNTISEDTLTLKSDMYNWSGGAYVFTDAWQVNSGAVLNLDTFRIRSLNLIVKNGAKLITKNSDGLNADLANQTITFEPTSMLEFAGSVPQNFEKAGGYNVLDVPNVIINNPAGVTVNIPDINISNSITFINGKVTSSNANYLTFYDNIQFNGASDNSFLNGPVRVSTASTGIKTIPVGKGNIYRGLVLIPTTAIGTDWIVEYFNQEQAFGTTLGPGLTNVSSAEYYLINRSGSANAVVGLVWGANSGVTNPVNLRVARWNDFAWEDKGNSGYIGDPTAGVVFSNMITEFSPFALASTDNQQLPVELASFNASTDRNNVTLNWITETEVNNSGYDLERKSAADTNWKKVTFVSGAGNSNSRKVYKYEDRNLTIGTYSYRLKQIDYNGNHAYYNLHNNVSVGIPNKYALGQNYPNPFNPSTKINFELPKDAKVTIQIYDMTGRMMASLIDNQSYQAGYHTIEMNGINLASGTYFYRIAAGDFTATKKMQLIK